MDEGATFTVWWQNSRCGILEALDDSLDILSKISFMPGWFNIPFYQIHYSLLSMSKVCGTVWSQISCCRRSEPYQLLRWLTISDIVKNSIPQNSESVNLRCNRDQWVLYGQMTAFRRLTPARTISSSVADRVYKTHMLAFSQISHTGPRSQVSAQRVVKISKRVGDVE